ncbi:AMP-binding protein [Actinosynnema sp. NPDC020468]|uniref:(2,3-dihydroxybenzoyl)adenylate synthase n=1 Tax=Actinosynnema sp. NPDC020468 TaxID=3154488 RepID=UPI0033EDDE9F
MPPGPTTRPADTARTLADLARGHDPDRTAVVADGTRSSYGALDSRADRLAAGLHGLGLRSGDRVVVQLPNGAAFAETLLACFRLGVVPVLALAAHRRAELAHLVRASAAVALVVTDVVAGFDHRDLAREVVPGTGVRHVLVAGEPGPFTALAALDADPVPLPAPDPSDPALLLLSGGTTGLPKLIPRTHGDYTAQLRASAAAMGFDRDGCYLAALPAAHNAALGCPGVLGALLLGAKVVFARTPSPDEVFGLIAREGVTLTTLMPPLLALWVDLAEAYAADLSGVVVEVGGAVLDPVTAARVGPVLGARLTHWFGMAEGPLACTRPDDPPERAAACCGTPLFAADEVRLVDEADREVPPGAVGRLLWRGPTTIRAYAEPDDAAFTADGFLRTGDLARREPDGSLVITGRTKDVVNRAGEKVSVPELELLLAAHPAVRGVGVVAVPDASLGEKTCAVVVAREAAPTLEELRDYLSGGGLAAFKLPDRLVVVDALPHTPAGKLDRRALALVAGA